MKTKAEIVTAMCHTFRHDFGLWKHPDDASFVAGMTDVERNALQKQMEQIFDNDIAPFMNFKTDDQIKYAEDVKEYFANASQYSE